MVIIFFWLNKNYIKKLLFFKIASNLVSTTEEKILKKLYQKNSFLYLFYAIWKNYFEKKFKAPFIPKLLWKGMVMYS